MRADVQPRVRDGARRGGEHQAGRADLSATPVAKAAALAE